MPYTVKESGFYGGTYYKAGPKPQDIPDAIARPFAAPYGLQLERAKTSEAKPEAKDKAEAEPKKSEAQPVPAPEAKSNPRA